MCLLPEPQFPEGNVRRANWHSGVPEIGERKSFIMGGKPPRTSQAILSLLFWTGSISANSSTGRHCLYLPKLFTLPTSLERESGTKGGRASAHETYTSPACDWCPWRGFWCPSPFLFTDLLLSTLTKPTPATYPKCLLITLVPWRKTTGILHMIPSGGAKGPSYKWGRHSKGRGVTLGWNIVCFLPQGNLCCCAGYRPMEESGRVSALWEWNWELPAATSRLDSKASHPLRGIGFQGKHNNVRYGLRGLPFCPSWWG